MKHFENWFFGVQSHVNDRNPQPFAYRYTGHLLTPWNLLRDFVERLTRVLDLMTIVLVILKILGYFDGGWVLVFMPSIVMAVLYIVRELVNARQSVLINKATNELRKKEMEQWEKDHSGWMKEMEEEDGDTSL